ncbi:MAG: hypothetical protein HOD72_02915 [Opitutae bacterium]|nr:hypothetical protein [Opitutae bacterium]MBT6959389.1 hypothetical protein [Opitutae bacterium]
MDNYLKIEKITFGMGDRFAHQAKAQLQACIQASDKGANVTPVWNKSHREHSIVGSQPPSVLAAAEIAIRELGWTQPFYIDADHINIDIVDGYTSCSNFFTIDVADSIGKPTDSNQLEAFLNRHPELIGSIEVDGLDSPIQATRDEIGVIAGKYLEATAEAGRIYRHILSTKGEGSFITEVSMDETDNPQTPRELLVILAALADENVPLQTIAPKFTGRFNKGVDYVGDIDQFEKEFNEDLAVIEFAIKQYGLPETLKLSVHSGSDKFSIYAPIRRALQATGAGLHIKTAGTTWLEELIGLAEAGGDGLAMAKEIYTQALENREALCAPYATVIDVDIARLPSAEEVQDWSAEQYTSALRHDQSNPGFNQSFRQLLHVGFKVAAKMGDRYLDMLDNCEESISRNVTENLYDRHLRPLLLG